MRLPLLASLMLLHGAALACGVCIEDKIAACYDHAIVEAAQQRGHAVAFFAIEGDLRRDDATRRAFSRAIESARGVRKASARVSLPNAALSFAYDPARTSPRQAGEAIGQTLGVRLRFLRML